MVRGTKSQSGGDGSRKWNRGVGPRSPKLRREDSALRTKNLCFHENHRDTQFWARAAHLLQCLGPLSLPPFEGR